MLHSLVACVALLVTTPQAQFEDGLHAVRAVDGAHRARNPGQQWQVLFDGRGFAVVPDQGGWKWGLELIGYGFPGDARSMTGTARARAEGARLSYAWDQDLEEWYVNDTRGLEHGYTLLRRPSRDAAGPLVIDLAVRGGLRPVIVDDGRGASFADDGGTTRVTYLGLTVLDATGCPVEARLESTASGIRVVIEEHGARYPLTVDPVAQQAYIKASNTDERDYFGEALAISGDTLVVGAQNEDSLAVGVDGDQGNGGGNCGAAYVFVRDQNGWVQQAYLKPSNTGLEDRFGAAVAISGDTIVVGAPREDSGSAGVNGNQGNATGRTDDYGAAYVFVREGTTWSQQAYLKASNPSARDMFGEAVAVSGDTVVVGSAFESGGSSGVNGDQNAPAINGSGAAYVFVRNGTTWSQQAYVKASNPGEFDRFGASLALSGDTMAIGAPQENGSASGVNGNQTDGSPNSGAVYVFARCGTDWSQQAYVKASNTGQSDLFGSSLAVSGDTLVVGALLEDSGARGVDGAQGDNSHDGSGAAYVFVRNGATWSQQAYLKASNTDAGDTFSRSVSISGDTLAVGASGEDSLALGVDGDQDDNSGVQAGAAYVFVREGAAWSQRAYLKASNTESLDLFSSVACSGETVAVGAHREDSQSTGVNGSQFNNDKDDSGAVYVFRLDPHCHRIDFETADDLSSVLTNGQHVDDEFGHLLVVTGSGSNAGVGVFDTTPCGPNAASQDPDLLVGTGNALILQKDNLPPNADDVFPLPDDDNAGGTLSFVFTGPIEARSLRLIDVDATDRDWAVVLVDSSNFRRTYVVPKGWTGDLAAGEPGTGILDLRTLLPQPGFASVATVSEHIGFDPFSVALIDVHVNGSGAIDDLRFCTSDPVSPQARAESRNGSGINPSILDFTSPPALGGMFTAYIDCTATGPGLAVIEVRRAPDPGTPTTEGERLVAGEVVFRATLPHSGDVSDVSWSLPRDISLAGMELHVQGLCRAQAVQSGKKLFRHRNRLSNALDLVLGF